jgi:hypothetical protein
MEEGAVSWRVHGPKFVSRAPVILFPLKFFLHQFAFAWGFHFPFPFSTELICGLTGIFGSLWWLLAGSFEMFDFSAEGEDMFLLPGMCPPSAEEDKMITLILTLIHEHFWFVNAAVALPVPSGIFHKVVEFLTCSPCVCFKQVVEQIVSGFSTAAI